MAPAVCGIVLTPNPAHEVEVFGPFDYPALPIDKAKRASAAVKCINPRLRNATATLLEFGSKLLEVKAELKRGQSGVWLEAELPFSIHSPSV